MSINMAILHSMIYHYELYKNGQVIAQMPWQIRCCEVHANVHEGICLALSTRTMNEYNNTITIAQIS